MERLAIKITPAEASDRLILTLSGPVTLADIFELQRVLQADESASTIVDMTDVPYVDSAGIGVLVNSYISREKSGRRLLLVGVRERVLNVLRTTRVDQFFSFFPTVEDAASELNPGAASAAG